MSTQTDTESSKGFCLSLRSKTCSACREGLGAFMLRVLPLASVVPGCRNIKALKSQTGVVKVGVLDRNDPANVEIARTLYALDGVVGYCTCAMIDKRAVLFVQCKSASACPLFVTSSLSSRC